MWNKEQSIQKFYVWKDPLSSESTEKKKKKKRLLIFSFLHNYFKRILSQNNYNKILYLYVHHHTQMDIRNFFHFPVD